MKLLITIALALGLAGSSPHPADACGGYTPSPEDQVRWSFAAEFPHHVHKTIHEIKFVDVDTVRVELRWAQKSDRAIAQFAWLELDAGGRWQRAGLSRTSTVWIKSTTSSPAVAAR